MTTQPRHAQNLREVRSRGRKLPIGWRLVSSVTLSRPILWVKAKSHRNFKFLSARTTLVRCRIHHIALYRQKKPETGFAIHGTRVHSCTPTGGHSEMICRLIRHTNSGGTYRSTFGAGTGAPRSRKRSVSAKAGLTGQLIKHTRG